MTAFRFKTVSVVSFCMVALLLLLGADSSQERDVDVPDISKRVNAFTLDFLNHIAGTTSAPANTVLSPQSVFHGMAMSYIASGGETRKELATIFHFPDDNQQFLKELTGLRRQLHAAAKHKRIDVSVANSVWLDETHADFRKEYVREVQDAFEASLHRVKFQLRDEASREINKWIYEKTRGKIGKGVSPEDLASRSGSGVIDEPALVSVNAVYFKADWGSRFDKASTRKRSFQLDASARVETMMMHQRSLLPYSENDDVQFLEIPYIDAGYSMYIILPKEVISIANLTGFLKTDSIVTLKRNAIAHEVDVLLPKFEMKSQLGVKYVLSKMGVKSAFDKGKADFDKMIVKKWEAFRIYISEIHQDAWIDVHEEGTEAAAATTTVHFSFGCSAPSRPMRAVFHADHPFLFMIVNNQSRSILFAGWISNPEEIEPQSRAADK